MAPFEFSSQEPLRVAVLVDLPRTRQSGGHVKYWERLAEAAAQSRLPLDLTIYFSGEAPTEILSAQTRICSIPPLLSTSRLKFLPYVPDHSDLAPYHPRLARELAQYDVIHTTDGFFAFAKTAERISHARDIPLVTSTHTDTVSYTRIFTRQMIKRLFRRWPAVQRTLIETWKIPERQSRAMEKKLKDHIRRCEHILITRETDRAMAESLLRQNRVHELRLGIDKILFGPHRSDRAGIERDYNIPPNRIVVLFVGRIDVGKNIYTLSRALEKLIAKGLPLHLVAAGIGPAMDDVKRYLGDHVSLPGFVDPANLARLYASTDILALCSEVEIGSMVAAEAIASGCPVLVSQNSGVAPVFDNTEAMQIVPSGVENWMTALRGFVADTDKQKEMRKAAVIYGRNHLASWPDVLVRDLFSVWVKAANAKHKQAA